MSIDPASATRDEPSIKRKTKRARTDGAEGDAAAAAAGAGAAAVSGSTTAAATPVRRHTAADPLLLLSSSDTDKIREQVLRLIYSDQQGGDGSFRFPQHFYRSLPGPLPISLSRCTLGDIERADYWCCEKSDGERCMLYIADQYNCFLIDRKWNVRKIKNETMMPAILPTFPSLFDGELMANKDSYYTLHSVIASTPQAGAKPAAATTAGSDSNGAASIGAVSYVYMIFDVIYCNGARIADSYLSKRLECIGTQIMNPYKKNVEKLLQQHTAQQQTAAAAATAATEGAATDPAATATPESATPSTTPSLYTPVLLMSKSFYRKHHLEKLFACITGGAGNSNSNGSSSSNSSSDDGDHGYVYFDGKRRNKNDGIIFTPEHDNYFCKQVPLYKWKWADLNTIDFMLHPPYFDNNNKLQLYSLATPHNPHAHHNQEKPRRNTEAVDILVRASALTDACKKKLLAQLSKSSSASSSHNWAQQLSESAARCKESIVAECGYDSNTGNWRIKSFRDDKNAANFITTVMATMESIIDNITKEQLIERCKRSKV